MAEAGIAEIFLKEAEEVITNLESLVLTLGEKNYDEAVIDSIYRCLHTLEESPGIAGFTDLHECVRRVEGLFDKVRSGEIPVTGNVIDLFARSIAWCRGKLRGDLFEQNRENFLPELVSRISFIQENDKNSSPEDDMDPSSAPADRGGADDSPKFYRISISFREDIFYKGIDPLMIIEDLESLGEFVCNNVNIKTLPDFYEIEGDKCYLGWEIILKTVHDEKHVRNVFLFVYEDNDIVIENITAIYPATGDRQCFSEKKLGELLVDRGIVNSDELDELIKHQAERNVKLGDIIVQKGLASENDIAAALREQTLIKKRIDINTVRVDSEKLDNLMNLLGEIVIDQASLHRIADIIQQDQAMIVKNALHKLDRATREFQEQIMSIRMIQIGSTFDQFKKFAGDTAQGLGREINFVTEGSETELDKTVIEKIADPLKLIIRDAIYNCIESAEERNANGKAPVGTVTLKAYHQEGNVFIDVIDDGSGINLEKVRRKAITLGMITEDDDVSKDKLLSFLFIPGFSTDENSGELSGRGTGMYVVKKNIGELRGSIEIKSMESEGTMVRIKLPLTLAIIDGMLIRVGKSIFIIPLLSVIETIQINEHAYKTVEGKGELIFVRDVYISLVRLDGLFGIKADKTDPGEALFVVVECDGKKMGIMIDELIGQQQVVIKSIDSYITDSRAISGATILGDGKVSLIIDIHGLADELKMNRGEIDEA